MSHVRGSHAVVIGGSMAGILSARALSQHFDQVTVLERDHLPDGPEVRKGVPHARHLHSFWAGGLQAVDGLLPGIRADLAAAGAVPVKLPTDFAWLTPANRWVTQFPATQELASASRPLLEWTVRRRVQETPGIEFLTGCDVTGLRLDGNGDVDGVLVRPRGGSSGERVLPADLVVDASGRGSRLPDWLTDLGLPLPKETVVDAHLGYATRVYAIPHGLDTCWKAAYVQGAPPRHPRGGIMFPIEGGRWIVTMIGGGGDYPPTDEDGYVAFARSLRSSLLYDAIAGAEPLTPITGYRRTANRRRHYEKLKAMPGRLLALGDSLCAFNPAYGQGMTVAAMQVRALDAVLRDGSASADLGALIHRAQRRVAKCVEGPWMLASGSDLRYDGVEGLSITVATRLQHRYLDRVLAAVAVDPTVNATFLRVLNLLAEPTAVFHPRVVARALSSAGTPHETVPPAPFPAVWPTGQPA